MTAKTEWEKKEILRDLAGGDLPIQWTGPGEFTVGFRREYTGTFSRSNVSDVYIRTLHEDDTLVDTRLTATARTPEQCINTLFNAASELRNNQTLVHVTSIGTSPRPIEVHYRFSSEEGRFRPCLKDDRFRADRGMAPKAA